MEEKKDKKKEGEIYSLVEMPTETTVVFKEESTGEILNDRQVLLKILNKIISLERHL